MVSYLSPILRFPVKQPSFSALACASKRADFEASVLHGTPYPRILVVLIPLLLNELNFPIVLNQALFQNHRHQACFSCEPHNAEAPCNERLGLPLHRPRGGLDPQRSRCVRSHLVDFPLHVIFVRISLTGLLPPRIVVPRARSGRPVTRLHPRATVFHDRESPRCGHLGRTLIPVVHPSRTVLRRAHQRTRSEIPNCISPEFFNSPFRRRVQHRARDRAVPVQGGRREGINRGSTRRVLQWHFHE